ncbi:hypothetical protein AQUCO_05400025v1 [Aquilegia coerulea]|uniref:AB hydrolase-1 domain-containing protein n=1 Tax=Aquilegia coerulea TaxID=218851 RepID=A0A2G5CH89_AQUCA|nr:hypothetical protein AQUCO_05400025v1 [Aquilegia coerulea]
MDCSSPVVFLHGFPEIWYSRRYQMIVVANAVFRAIAPHCRVLVDDLLALLDFFNISNPKAFLVAKDFGVRPAYHFALIHPEKEPGRAEADFGRFDVKTVVRNIYILFSGCELPVSKEDPEIMDLVLPSTPLPSWFTEADLANYASLYEKSGFRTALAILWSNVHIPAILSEKDYAFRFPGMAEYKWTSKRIRSDLDITYLPEGTHFVQEQFPDQVNQLILTFLNKHI